MNERALAVRNEIGIEQLGAIFAQSGFFADTRSAAQAIVKIIAGSEMGFGPMASMRGIHIIKGKPTVAADMMAAAIQRSGRYQYRILQLDNSGCVIDFYEVLAGRREKIGTSTFSVKDAQAADLMGSDLYQKFPRNMLFSRALSNGARWYCPEVFSGAVYTPEEMGAEADEEGHVISVPIEVPQNAPQSVPVRVQDADDADVIRSADDRLWKRWEALLAEAQGLRCVPKELQRVKLPLPRQKLIEHGIALDEKVRERKQLLAEQDAQVASIATEAEMPEEPAAPTAEGQASAGAESAPLGDNLWQRNRALQAEAYALGLRLKDLPVTATDDEIQRQNEVIEQWLAQRPQMAL